MAYSVLGSMVQTFTYVLSSQSRYYYFLIIDGPRDSEKLRNLLKAQSTKAVGMRKAVSGMLIQHNGNQQLLSNENCLSVSNPCRFSHRDFERLKVFPVGRCGERGIVKPKS